MIEISMCFKRVPLSSLVLGRKEIFLSDSEKNILRASIESNGIILPLYVRPYDYHQWEVFDGNKRLLVLREMEVTCSIPCLIYNLLDDRKCRELVTMLSSFKEKWKTTETELILFHKELTESLLKTESGLGNLTNVVTELKELSLLIDKICNSYLLDSAVFLRELSRVNNTLLASIGRQMQNNVLNLQNKLSKTNSKLVRYNQVLGELYELIAELEILCNSFRIIQKE